MFFTVSVKPVKPKAEQTLFNYFGAKKDASSSKLGGTSGSTDSELAQINEGDLFDDDEWLREMDEPQIKKLKC